MKDESPLIAWQTPSQFPILAKNEVHVCCANLNLDDSQLAKLSLLLSAEEKSRAERFKFEIHRKRYTAAKGILRLILADYLQVSAQEIIFALGKHGKPYLQFPSDSRIFFNASDSQNLALYAVSQQEVGIDIEYVREEIDPEGIVERFFSPYEIAELKELPIEQRKLAFFKGWTRKEAFIKGLGEGLSFPLDQFDVNLKDEKFPLLLMVRRDRDLTKHWMLFSLSPAKDYVGALAIKGKDQGYKILEMKKDLSAL